jgi:MFS family permease
MAVDLTPQPSRLKGPLASAPYRWLVAGATITNLGNAIAPVALAFAVLDLGGSASELGTVIALYALADVATVLFGGVLGDRLPRQFLMVGTAMLAALAQAVIAAALIGGWATIPLLAVIGMANGALGALNGPSSQAMTKQTVPDAQLSPAISLRRICQNAAQIVGFALAGVLVAAIGAGWAIGVDAATFAVAALCYSRLRVPHLRTPSGLTMLGDLGAGFREVLSRTWLWVLILQALVYHLFYGGAQGVLGPIVVGDGLGRPAWGWAMAAMMTGFLVGGLVSLRWRPRRALFIGTWFLALTAAFPLAMALSDSLTVVLLGAFLHGFGLEIFSVGWDLSILQNVPEDKLARVYSFDQVGSFVARPLGLALTGPVAQAVGFDSWLVVVGAVMAGSTFLALLLPDVRRLERRA